jgi:sulfatase modifying factor 1
MRKTKIRRQSVKAKALYMIVLMLVATNLLAKEKQPPQKYTQTTYTNAGKKLTFDMVLIPGGQFQMGSPANEAMRKDDEGPQHTVKLDPFYLCTTETTLALFSAYYKETATAKREFVAISAKQKELEQAKQDEFDGVTGPTPVYGDIALGHTENFPAMAMSWRNAVLFCKWVSKRTGKTYRLPTEAEWEYACRAGSGTRFCFGDSDRDLGGYGWYDDNSGRKTHPVAQKKPNAWGLYDLHGNVWEWCQGRYGKYPSGSVVDPIGSSSGAYRVKRGGSWFNNASSCRSARRSGNSSVCARPGPYHRALQSRADRVARGSSGRCTERIRVAPRLRLPAPC